MIYLREVPAAFEALVKAKAAYVQGSVVKDGLTHQVLAHLQPTQRLTDMIMSSVSAGPMAPVNVVSSLVGNIQLLEIRGMLQTLQTIATIGAGASVLGLGVSIGGFAMVIASLRRIERKMDELVSTVHRIESLLTSQEVGETATALSRAENAFTITEARQRQRYWEEADHYLDVAINVTLKRLATQGINLDGAIAQATADLATARRLCAPETVQLLNWLLTLASARSEVLLGLQMPTEAARLSRQTAGWMSTLPFDAKTLARAQLDGRTLPPTQMSRVTTHAKGLATLVQHVASTSEQRALLCDTLHEQGVDTVDYVLAVRNDPAARVMLLPASPSSSQWPNERPAMFALPGISYMLI